MLPRNKGRLLIAGGGILCLALGLAVHKLQCGNSFCFPFTTQKSEFIRFSGRVTYVDAEAGFFCLQNDTSAVRVESAETPSDIDVGQEVGVVGSSDEDPKSGVVRFARIQTRKPGSVPKALSIAPDSLFEPRYANRRVEVAGIVRSATVSNYGRLRMRLSVGQRMVEIRAQEVTGINFQALIDTKVRVTGVLQTALDADGNYTRLLLLVQSTNDFVFDRAALNSKRERGRNSQRGARLPVLTKVAQVHGLTLAQASQQYPVKLSGIITFFDPVDHSFFFSDNTGGIYVSAHFLADRGFRAGQRIELKGYSGPGEFAPVVTSPEVRILGPGMLPKAGVEDMYEIFSGHQDSNWVEVRGVVRSITTNKGRAVMNVNWSGKQFRVRVLDGTVFSKSIIDADIRAQGVCASLFNSKRQLTGIFLMVPRPELLHIERKPTPPEALLPKQIQELGRFSADEEPGHRQRVEATVTYAGGHGPIYVSDETGALRVDADQTVPVRAGDLVEVLGFPKQGPFGPTMSNAELHVIRHGPLVKPVRVSAEEALDDRDEGQLLQIDATLMDRVAIQGGEILLLRSGHSLFQARLAQRRAPAASKGSVLRLTGICIMELRQGWNSGPAGFSLLVPSSGDVLLLRPAPWWTAQSILWLLFAVGGVSLLASVWAIALRRQVNRQTEVIRDQLEEAEALRHAAETAARAKGQFLANMSHEIRTPLNGILGMTELALTEESPTVVREHLETVRISGLGLLRVINDVLDFSKIEAGRMTMEYAPFDLKTTLVQAIDLFKPAASEKGLRLRAEYPEGAPQHFVGDSMRVRQIAINLIGNAIKFTARGEVRAEVQQRSNDAGMVTVRIAVHDTGIGVPLEQQSQLFQSFTQADASTTRKYGGTGLGLAISKQLVELMGGTVGLQSEAGKGSTFWFELPLAMAPAPTGAEGEGVAPGSTHEQDDQTEGGKARVLLAEDNAVNQKLTRRLLEQLGWEVEIACDGAEAVLRLDREAYSLVLMDCQMPVMDGYEATMAIRQREQTEGRTRTPIIALTANAFSEDRRRCLDAGMDDYLTKPVCADELRDAARRWSGVVLPD